jgi:hypothetical protein
MSMGRDMSLNCGHQRAYCSSLRWLWVWKATVEWYWQGTTKDLVGNPVPVRLCPPKVPSRLIRARTRASVVRGRSVPAWAMSRTTMKCWREKRIDSPYSVTIAGYETGEQCPMNYDWGWTRGCNLGWRPWRVQTEGCCCWWEEARTRLGWMSGSSNQKGLGSY